MKISDLSIPLEGSAGHILVKPGFSCGRAKDGLFIELESEIQTRLDNYSKLYIHGGVMTREDMKRLRDLIDAELSEDVE